jgi:RNA polymerase sigma factor (sigma-70 family)
MRLKSNDPTLADPRLHHALGAMVRKRVPEGDADDIVQSALTEALASKSAPEEAESLRKWLFAVAKNKIADYYRKRRREQPTEAVDVAAEETPYSERDLLRWAENQLPPGSDSPKTLEWMLREGEGEKLESIAESEQVPAPRVRQRVSRMRRFLKGRWLLAAAIVGVVVVFVVLYRPKQPEVVVRPEPKPVVDEKLELAKQERAKALEACDRHDWTPCIDGLDRAKAKDRAGDMSPAVTTARQAASDAKLPPPPIPSASAAPPPRPRPTSTSAPIPMPTSSGGSL